jgi:hypothetical protein
MQPRLLVSASALWLYRMYRGSTSVPYGTSPPPFISQQGPGDTFDVIGGRATQCVHRSGGALSCGAWQVMICAGNADERWFLALLIPTGRKDCKYW